MPTRATLEAKINELAAEVERLETQVQIDPLTASATEITQNAREQQEARANAQHLRTTIDDLNKELKIEIDKEQEATLQEKVERGFEGLIEQAENVADAIKNLETAIADLREMSRAIASLHKQEKGVAPLDDLIPASYQLPKIERLRDRFVLHTSPVKFNNSY